MREHALYRFFDGEGQLLYVGVALDPGARWRRHRREQPWWTEVVTVTLERRESRAEVLIAERLAIRAERPKYNVVHNGPDKPEPKRRRVRTNRPEPKRRQRRPLAPMPVEDAAAMCWSCREEDDAELSVYLPFSWADGAAEYICRNDHIWSDLWPGLVGAGEAAERAGAPVVELYLPEPGASPSASSAVNETLTP